MTFFLIGHRGAPAYSLENTLDSFEKAIQLGMNAIEVDVHITKDEYIVVYHDYFLNGTPIEDMTYDEVKTFRLPNGDSLPRFEDVIELAKNRALIYIDLKTPYVTDRLIQTLRTNGLQPDDFIVSSFHHPALRMCRERAPSFATSVLFRCWPEDIIGLARSVDAQYVHFCWENMAPHPARLLSHELLEEIHSADLGVIIWHEERESELEVLQHLPIEGICSDDPIILRKYFSHKQANQ